MFCIVLKDHILCSQAVQVFFYNHMTKLANDSFKGCRTFSSLPSLLLEFTAAVA